jgi:hypothetical protein
MAREQTFRERLAQAFWTRCSAPLTGPSRMDDVMAQLVREMQGDTGEVPELVRAAEWIEEKMRSR